MARTASGVDLERWSAPAAGSLLLLAFFAFWPTYLASPGEFGTLYTHLHAATATTWFVLLIVQPILIRTNRRALHRRLGATSWVLAPLVVLGILLGAHSRLDSALAALPDFALYVLYLQVGLGAIFLVVWGLGMRHRADRKVHARFMAATGLTFVDPVVARLLPEDLPVPFPIITFMLVNVILVGLIWAERDAKRGRWAFPTVLALFVLMEIPLFLAFPESAAWEGFAHWFLSLPMT